MNYKSVCSFLASMIWLASPLEAKEYDHFIYLRGNANEKKFTDSFSLMTWNICALPGKLPTLYGGVRPAEERLQEIVDFIVKADADIVCFQEAHDLAFSYQLYEKLKEVYCHFVIDIGRVSILQLNSGLFVATKMPIKELEFEPFSLENVGPQKAIKKGVLVFKAYSGDKDLAYIATTHLQPYKTEKDAEIRKEELQLAVNKLKAHPEGIVKIVCGDLNIDRFPPEEGGRELIKADFYDPLYPQGASSIPITCTNYLEYYSNTENPVPVGEYTDAPDESMDYCVVLGRTGQKESATHLIPAYDNHKPKEAVSDHHAVFTTFHD